MLKNKKSFEGLPKKVSLLKYEIGRNSYWVVVDVGITPATATLKFHF